MAAQSRTQKKIFHMAYSIGASIVIIGALFKILHMSLGPLTGGILLMIGLGVEAFIFFLSAFEPIQEDLDWSKVYPELAGGEAKAKKAVVKDTEEVQGLLSKKLDDMLKEAKLDSSLMKSLGESIQSFKGAAEQIQPAVSSISATNKYSEQLSLAASQMESLNSLYKVQLESSSRQAQANEDIARNAQALKEQMHSMAANLQSLNNVYGGMLSAMNKG
ncbi:MAG: gliding motility protein GldL [Flavobacteriaceae bacterium]|jgi:gliding motility-associated protein GldL|nr:gliding motility protein GldL [Flavobacteriaceae bacterium]